MRHARSEGAAVAARDDDTREAGGKRHALEEVLPGSWAGTTTSDAGYGFLEPWVDSSRDCKDSAAGAERSSGAHRLADKEAGVVPAVHWGACIRLWRDDSMKNCSST